MLSEVAPDPGFVALQLVALGLLFNLQTISLNPTVSQSELRARGSHRACIQARCLNRDNWGPLVCILGFAKR